MLTKPHQYLNEPISEWYYYNNETWEEKRTRALEGKLEPPKVLYSRKVLWGLPMSHSNSLTHLPLED